MTFLAKRFKIRWVICAIFRQFKNMVTMAQVILNGMKAVLTKALVALVNVLLELHPIVNLRTPIPGVSYIWDFRDCKKRSHNSPYTTTLYLNKPHHNLPHTTLAAKQILAITYRALPDHSRPLPAAPVLNKPRRAASRHYTPLPQGKALPYLTQPHLPRQNRTQPGRITPCQPSQGLTSPHPYRKGLTYEP